MKIVMIAQLRDEHEKGNLVRFLDNARLWADEIVLYDDCSSDGSRDIYPEYTSNVILGEEPMFHREIYVKAQLLRKALDLKPRWIVWQDGDAIMDRTLTTNMRQILSNVERAGKVALQVHYLNLWRHPAWHRLDNRFNGLWPVAFWKSTGNLKYRPEPGLHHRQYPNGIPVNLIARAAYQIVHYGFASEEAIVRKYLTYKSHGQTGWPLDRLIDEQTTFSLAKVNQDLYPEGNVPPDWGTAPKPQPLTYDQYRQYGSWEEWKEANQ